MDIGKMMKNLQVEKKELTRIPIKDIIKKIKISNHNYKNTKKVGELKDEI